MASVNVTEQATPSTPSAGTAEIYVDSTTKKLASKDDAGTVTDYISGGAPPTAHAASHTDGTDDIQSATAAQKGLATAAQITKLDAIEALADVTDATNVNAAGAVMESDYAAKGSVLAATAAGTPSSLAVGSDGDVLTADAAEATGVKWAASASAYIVPCCAMGGKSDGLGKFVNANGATTMNDDSSKARTRAPVIVPVGSTAKIVGVSYQTQNGTTNVQMKAHINGLVVETFTLANINANKGGQENWAGFAVVAGDYLELEYDSDGGVGDKPGESIWWFLMEITP